MKPYSLMHLFRHIVQKTVCPYCKEGIIAEKIKVDASSEESAFLTIYCPCCLEYLHAHVYAHISDDEREPNFETEFSDISADELQQANNILRTFSGDVSTLFSPNK